MNECSWVCFVVKFNFFEILRCWTRSKNWSWFVLFCRSTTRRDWFKMTQNFYIIIMNKHTRLSYLRKQNHQSFISRWISSRFARFFFFFAKRFRKRRWLNYSFRFQNVKLIDVHFLKCNQDWNFFQSRFLQERKIHWLKFTLDIVNAFQRLIDLKLHNWINKIE